MTLNNFKDLLFDTINESDILNVSDITWDDTNHTFTLFFADGSSFVITCANAT